MNVRFSLFAIAVAMAALWSGAALAQNGTAANPAAVHTVHPREYSVAAQAGVTTTVLPEGEALSVKSSGVDSIIIELGWMPVQPRTAYRASYRVRGESLADSASVYLLVREHEAQGVRPITPYHVTNARSRELKPEQVKTWLERGLNFTTGDKTRALSGSIIISKLTGELQFSPFEILDSARIVQPAPTNAAPAAPAAKKDTAQAQAEYEQVMKEVRAQADARVPLVPRTLVFSRAQMKYGLEKNYYHQWNDRPLLVNRDYRVPAQHVTPAPSYKRILEEVVDYDIDGLAFFPETTGRMGMFDVHDQVGVKGVGLLPEFVGVGGNDYLEKKVEVLQRALKSPHTPKINGKVLITSYAAESLTPAEWNTILQTLRTRVSDQFIFLPSLTNVVSLRGPFSAGEPISRELIEKEKAFLRSYLDVSDGIYFNYPAAFRNKDRTFDDAFYRDIFIPVFKSVLSEPAYRNKYFGLSAYKSHMSPERGNSLHEDNTRTMRRSFEAAMDAKPDVLILPEWDEFNENTGFRPTVYGSTASKRILRYYMSRIKNIAPTPVAGDDVSVPNLIFSTRKVVALGEQLSFELLNVPDSLTPGSYTVELALQDAGGRVVRSFDPVTFDATKLQEQRFTLATETIPEVQALIPVLTVRGYKGKDLTYDTGFQHVQVRATWNWDHMAVKQPLRDLLRPAIATFTWETPTVSTPGAPLTLTGTVSSPEDLALVEVLGDDDEAFAVDPTNEFFRNDSERELVLIEYRSLNTLEMKGSLTLNNATAEWLTNGSPLHQPETKEEVQSNKIELTTPVSEHIRWIYLAIPKSKIGAAELNFDFDKAKFSIPVKDIFEQKMIARGFENGLHISAQPYRRQIDMPRHLNKKDVSFRVQVWPEIATEQYHLRLTSVNGKLYRSRPLLLPAAGTPSTETLRVYSDAQKRGVDVTVAADRIPRLAYDFSPRRGAVLLTDAGRPFWSSLGGFTNTTTGRGTMNGLFRGKYPATSKRSAPEWVTENGAPVLEFDGAGTYLELPREAIPWRGAFTIEFEINPDSNKNQMLLVNRVGGAQTGLSLEIRDGKLLGSFRDREWANQRFDTGLEIPANAWSNSGVNYDFENLTFSVNGKSKSFPLTLPASNIGFTVIGEGWNGNWFDGRLRNLRIVHNTNARM